MIDFLHSQYNDTFLAGTLQLSSAFEDSISDQSSLFDDVVWTNPFSDPVLSKTCSSECNVHNLAVSKLETPTPVRKPASHLQDGVEEIDLERALEGMMMRGELEQFLMENTISLRQLQDDSGITYRCESPKQTLDTEALAAPLKRPRRHSIGTASELIRCPFPGCGKIFSRMFNLKSHYKTHSGERPYKCEHCDQDFARTHDLKRHLRIHVGHRPFECQRCRKSFSRLDALNRHLKINSCIPVVSRGIF